MLLFITRALKVKFALTIKERGEEGGLVLMINIIFVFFKVEKPVADSYRREDKFDHSNILLIN